MRARPAAGLAVGVLAISWGAPLARLADAAPLAVAMWRMTLAAVLILPFALARGALRVPPRHRGAALLAGLLLGTHFGLWIPSLWLTSVSASVVLVTTQPLWVLLASPRFLGVRIRGRNVASFLLALAGVAIIAWGDFHVSLRALAGDAMALAGAVAMAAYMVVGKRLRSEVPLPGYLAVVYAGAAVTLIAAVLLLRVPPAPRVALAWLPLLGLALVPTLTGHTLLNWALAHLEAYRVNLAVLLEPVLASIWAWLFVGEAPPLHVLPGALLVLGALALEFVPAEAP
ncbi:MAG TPA: DMT family transporter [Thermoanaerobaculaceae bacterium]|nr:DMT family transporter [Thermoanaerobaculaceae bacterium]